MIYTANNGGVLEFDGRTRRLIGIPNQWAHSLAIDREGTVYVGGVNQFGYLTAGGYSKRRYQSLVHHIGKRQRKFSTVWRIDVTGEGVYFRTLKFLFRWRPKTKKIAAWKPETSFNASFSCNGKLFVQQSGVGLMVMERDSLKLIPGGETFSAMNIRMMVPYRRG
ncbi:MAG: histidine kinase, partial [bacterium]|nr:histidine kinase [bacterium]